MIHQRLRALVLSGDGIHCDLETAQALKMVRFEVDIKNLNDLIYEQMSLDDLSRDYALLAIPGGYSFGDDISAGKVLGIKIQKRLNWDLNVFAARGGLVIGSSNGFQTLIRMGIFGKDVSITHNIQGKFVENWVKITPEGVKCAWLKGLGTIDVPLRSSEGRVIIASSRRGETLDKMMRLGMTCLKYETNPNGSEENLAGLCDTTGRILGLMPYPEAFIRWSAHPEWTAQPNRVSAPGQGLMIFENAFQEASSAR